MMTLPSTTEMYRALVERDQSFEGLFYACVRTTGIFCRPTCHARKPKPENVEFAPTIQEALHRGYRPCQLCEPMSAGTAAPNWLAPLLDEIKAQPDLKLRDHDLRVRGLDPVQVRRTFKRSFGMTFQAYQRAVPARHGDEGAARRRADDRRRHGRRVRVRQRLPRGLRAGVRRDARPRARHGAADRDVDRESARADAGDCRRRGTRAAGVRRSPRARDGTARAARARWRRAIVPGDHPILRQTADAAARVLRRHAPRRSTCR